MFAVQSQLSRRTIHVRLSGVMSEQEMERFAEEYRRATDSYHGEAHLVLADMRGLKTCSPPVAMILMDAIGYARKRGVAVCAHISDDTVTRLQLLRLGRKVSEDDDVTVDVVSLEEAEGVLAEKRFEIRLKSGPQSPSWAPPPSSGSGNSPSWMPPSSGGASSSNWAPPSSGGGSSSNWAPPSSGSRAGPSWAPPPSSGSGAGPSWAPPPSSGNGAGPSWAPPSSGRVQSLGSVAIHAGQADEEPVSSDDELPSSSQGRVSYRT